MKTNKVTFRLVTGLKIGSDMPLHRLADFDPSYKETFGGEDIKALDVYTEGDKNRFSR